MATATKKIPPTSPPPHRPERQPSPSLVDRLVGVVDGIYRFLASVKLAVFSIASLAGTLAYATFFEKWYGTAAVQRVHLPRALFRDPARVPRHEHPVRGPDPLPVEEAADGLRHHPRRAADRPGRGLLQRADVRRGPGRDARGRRPQRAGAHGPSRHPGLGSRPAHPEIHPRDRPALPSRLVLVGAGSSAARRPGRAAAIAGPVRAVRYLGCRRRDLDQARRPVSGRREGIPDGLGAERASTSPTRTARRWPGIRVRFKAPGMPEERDAFPTEDSQWFVTEKKFYRAVREPMRGAPAVVTFSAVDRPGAGRGLPQAPGRHGRQGRRAVPLRRQGRDRPRSFDWPLDGQEGKSVALPDSDLTVTLTEVVEFPHPGALGLDRVLGDGPGPDRRVQDPEGRRRAGHAHGDGQLADGPELIPSPDEPDGAAQAGAGGDPLHRRAVDRPQDQRPVRRDRRPGRSRPDRSITASSAGARRAGASSAPPGRCRAASRSSPSAARPTCR